ncbi:MAG: hypothetical protein BWZ09_00281 [Alphaproteobacteria bacterium ADurb.BinA305]|nr:MAG: hypothetical protein BWZ09_00281 [Alphaproteobacteria bacterium ADurb.BinA305]
MVFCAHSSHFQIWMSVPQIAVFLILMRTSLGPTSGFSTLVSVSPTDGVNLAKAFMGFLSIDISGRGHAIAPSALPTLAKAATARSICAVVCAALICVRMRALPLGTTG